jgi:hypothetical protein
MREHSMEREKRVTEENCIVADEWVELWRTVAMGWKVEYERSQRN